MQRQFLHWKDSMAHKRTSSKRIPLKDFFLINTPVWLSMLGLGLFIGLYFLFTPEGWQLVWLAIPAWWCVCIAFLMFMDYTSRKRRLYLLLRQKGLPEPGTALDRYLRQTLCGAALRLAVRRNLGTTRADAR